MTAATVEKDNLKRARKTAEAVYRTIKKEVAALEKADKKEDEDARDAARQTIHEGHYGIQVRSDWYSPGERAEPGEYQITLAGGGPAVRLTGDIEEGEAISAKLQYQDWFTPWTDLENTIEMERVLLVYAQTFYFGEG